jgi:hypothetical protein
MKKITFCVFLVLQSLSLFAQDNGKTSIAMLNHLATEARIINSSKDNRLILEDIYNKLVNNSDPTVIDETTLGFFEVLLEYIENFRIITYQRERLQFLFQNQQAQAITQALPNPLYLLGARDKTPLALIATATTMAIDSAFKYQSAKNDAKLAYLQGDWELDDRESAILHNLRSRSFVYMVNISTQYKLSRDDTLNEKSIDDFVVVSLWDASPRKRQTLEANRGLYAKYGPYWLELAETYYELGLYSECLSALQEYEKVQVPIFRKNRKLARLIPKAIVATSNVYGNNAAYTNLVTNYLKKLIDNTSDSDWALRYFAAQTYISIAADSNRRTNLQTAYDLLLNNVRILSIEQEKILNEYYSPITVVPQSLLDALEDAQKKLTQAKIDRETVMNNRNTKIGKEQRAKLDNDIKEAEKKVKEWGQKITVYKNSREKELPPFSQALWLNYALLTDLFTPLNKTASDIQYVHDIIDVAFWPLYMMEAYWELTREDDYSSVFFISSLSRSGGLFSAAAKGWNYGNSLFFLRCPDAVLTAVNSIDVKILNADDDTVLCDDKNVKWEVSSKLNRDYFGNRRIFLAEIGIYISINPDYKKNEAYKMEILIKNIDEQGSYNNRLHFENPIGKTDWVFKYVE